MPVCVVRGTSYPVRKSEEVVEVEVEVEERPRGLWDGLRRDVGYFGEYLGCSEYLVCV